MDQQGPEKVLRVLKYLMSNISLTVDELACRLDTSRRTLYRYIDTFRTAGYNVQHLRGSVYRIEDSGISNAQLEQPERKFRHTVKELRRYALAHPHYSETARVNRLKTAIKEERKVILRDYRSSETNRIKDRHVEPYDFTSDFSRVWAYDLYEGRNIVFKISRIGGVKILDEKWTHSQHHRRQNVDIFGHSGRLNKKIVLKMDLRAANYLQELFPESVACVSHEGRDWYLKACVHDFDGVCTLFAGMLDHIEILAPNRLKEYLTEFVHQHYGAYFGWNETVAGKKGER